MIQAPISLRLRPRKSTTRVGEGLVFDIDHAVHAPVEMQTVELNEDRTRLTLERLSPGRPITITLSGRQHRSLHGLPLFTDIGRRFTAAAGERWTSQLNLFDYTRPLPAGHYRLGLHYQWSEADADIVSADSVAFEIVATDARPGSDRWFATTSRRGEWGRLWSTADGTAWFYQLSSGDDPGVLSACTDIGLTAPDAQPLLAHLEALSGQRFERQMTWADGRDLHWLRFSVAGPLEAVRTLAHGLEGLRPCVADPPLARLDGGLEAVFTVPGGAGAWALRLSADDDGRARLTRHSLGDAAADLAGVMWRSERADAPADADLVTAALGDTQLHLTHLATGRSRPWHALGAGLAALRVEQWMGRAAVFAIGIDGHRILVWRLDGNDLEAPPHPLASHSLLELPLPLTLVDAVVLDEGGDVALSVHGGDILCLLSRSVRQSVRSPLDRARMTRLIATRRGLYLELHDATAGFRVRPIGAQSPLPGI